MQKVAIIGAGISGLSTAHFLSPKYEVTVFEKCDRSGGLIKCIHVNGSLFHTCGGHVFNSKRKDVLDWFWSMFDCEREFSKANRYACVFLDEKPFSVPYPIENHVYLFNADIQKRFYQDLEEIDQVKGIGAKFDDYENFADFLRWRFGKTLYNIYFKPYNEKVWRCDLSCVPMSWMEGKLPMPSTREMRDNNEKRIEEQLFVHSSFWYEKVNGSQYIADKLSKGLNVKYNSDISSIKKVGGKWIIQGEFFDKVVFCGNIKDLPKMIDGVDISMYANQINALEYHGTTAVFCEVDRNPYSWIYQPSSKHESHRIICTGNFSSSNNDEDLDKSRITATIEFTDEISLDCILMNLNQIPLHPKYLSHQYNKYSYPIQDSDTRKMIKNLKTCLAHFDFFFTGRFADWEYYNMDVAIGAAMDLCKTL